MSTRLFYVPLVQFITLECDLTGTRSRFVQVKMLSDRKAGIERQSSDIVSDVLFHFTLKSWFRRRGEPHAINLSRFLTSLTDSHGELSQHRVILTGDG